MFNGIDTGTNNHGIGANYCASGSTNCWFPCLAAQYARAQIDSGLTEAIPLFVNTQGYVSMNTADLVSPANLSAYYSIVPSLFNPNTDPRGANPVVDTMVDSKMDAGWRHQVSVSPAPR